MRVVIVSSRGPVLAVVVIKQIVSRTYANTEYSTVLYERSLDAMLQITSGHRVLSPTQCRRVLSAKVVRAACWPPPPSLEMCAQCGSTISATRLVPVVDNVYPYPTGRTRPAPKISTPDYIGMGDSHNHTSSQNHSLIIPLPRPMVIVYGYEYTRGRVGSGRSEATLTPVACRAIGSDWANGRDAHK